jgi:predicted F0F1-ATPase subunit
VKKDDLLDTVDKEKKRLEEKARGGRGLWRYVVSAGSVGWMVVLPAFGGAFLGRYLDHVLEVRGFWTLSLMFLGLVAGIYWVWYTNFRKGAD